MKMLEFKKFSCNDIDNHSSICIIAKRNSGKSWLVRDIVYSKRDIPVVIVIAPTDKLNGFYDKFIPSVFIYYEYSSCILDNIFRRQEKIISSNKKRKKLNKKPIDSRLLLIMDDCLASKSLWAKDKNIYELLQNGRHYHITYILTMQYSLGIQPELRSNFDFIFLLNEDFINNQKRLYEHYAGMFDNFDTFKNVFITMTDNYGIMVLNSQKKSKMLSDKVFWYRAEMRDKFIVGCDKLKAFHNDNFNTNWRNKKNNGLSDSKMIINVNDK